MALMPELLPLYAPTVNSYKRLVEGAWAPTKVNWGIDNRTTALRVIPGSPKSTRLETRVNGSRHQPLPGAGGGAGQRPLRHREQADAAARRRSPAAATPTARPPALPRNLDEATRALEDSEHRPRAVRRGVRRALRRQPQVGVAAVEPGRHQLGAGALLRDHLIDPTTGERTRPMAIHQYNFPTRIQYGPGPSSCCPTAPEGAGKQRPLMVTDKGLAELRPVTGTAQAAGGRRPGAGGVLAASGATR